MELSLPGLRWYGTPLNIYKNERILKSYYFKNAFFKFKKRVKTITGEIFEPATYGLLNYPSTH